MLAEHSKPCYAAYFRGIHGNRSAKLWPRAGYALAARLLLTCAWILPGVFMPAKWCRSMNDRRHLWLDQAGWLFVISTHKWWWWKSHLA